MMPQKMGFVEMVNHPMGESWESTWKAPFLVKCESMVGMILLFMANLRLS